MRYCALLALENQTDFKEVKSAIESEYVVKDYAGDAMELLAKCRKLKPDILIADLQLPLLSGMKMVHYLQKQDWVKCVIIMAEQRNSDFSKDDLHDIDGVIMKPFNKNNILPCIMMAVARNEKKQEVLKEYEEMESEFRQGRALEYVKQNIRNCYGLSDEDALKMLKKSALENGEKYTELAELMFDADCSEYGGGGKKDGRQKQEIYHSGGRR